MSKKFIVLLSTGLALIVFAGAFVLQSFSKSTGENLSKQSNVEPMVEVKLDDILDSNNIPTLANTTYGDYSASLKEMKKASDAIVIAKPTSYNQGKAGGVISKVSVLKTLKGKKFDEILIYQIGRVTEDNTILSGDVLELNKEYVLFLGKQGCEDNAFYVKAGVQGAFLNENGKLTNKDKTMQDDVKKILKDKKSDYESLLDFAIE